MFKILTHRAELCLPRSLFVLFVASVNCLGVLRDLWGQQKRSRRRLRRRPDKKAAAGGDGRVHCQARGRRQSEPKAEWEATKQLAKSFLLQRPYRSTTVSSKRTHVL